MNFPERRRLNNNNIIYLRGYVLYVVGMRVGTPGDGIKTIGGHKFHRNVGLAMISIIKKYYTII